MNDSYKFSQRHPVGASLNTVNITMSNKLKGVCAVVEYDYTAKEPDELNLVKGAIIKNIKQMPGGWWEGTLSSESEQEVTGMFPDNFVRIIENESTVTLRNKSSVGNRRCKVIYSYTQVNDDELSLAVGDIIEFLGEVEEGWWRGRLKNKVGVFPSNFVVPFEPSPILASKRPTLSVSAAATTTAKESKSSSETSVHSTTVQSQLASSSVSSNMTKKINRPHLYNSKEDILDSGIQFKSSIKAATEAAPSLPPKPQRDYCRVEFPYEPQNDDELQLNTGDIITIISMDLPDKGWWKGESNGKIGVFPDNFVKLLHLSEVSPSQEHQLQKTSKISSSSTVSAPTTSKSFVKSSVNSNRKDSFGSRDSLDDILHETGLPSGNVATQRKSLESKNLDLSSIPDATSRFKKPLADSAMKTNAVSNMSSNNSSTSPNDINSNHALGTNITPSNENRRSMEMSDEKPPVLSKKPSVPSKKTSSVSSVAGNILSGLKQKVRNVENKLTTAASQDSADGLCSSKMSANAGNVPELSSGNVVMRRAATIAVEDTDFDRVERASILSDMRAGRVKAPKRRPPSAAINVVCESNNNSLYINGSTGIPPTSDNDDVAKVQSSDDNSIEESEAQLAKPKPRQWESKKAPWMEELKASQVKMKTVSPIMDANSTDRVSKSFIEEVETNTSTSKTITSSSTVTSATASKVQSRQISSSIKQQNISSVMETGAATMDHTTKSNCSSIADGSSDKDEVAILRTSRISIRNRSTSPLKQQNMNDTSGGSVAPLQSYKSTAVSIENSTDGKIDLSGASGINKTSHLYNHHTVCCQNYATGIAADNCRVLELEKRVQNLESMVNAQQKTIELLRGELEKYAQCVTQV